MGHLLLHKLYLTIPNHNCELRWGLLSGLSMGIATSTSLSFLVKKMGTTVLASWACLDNLAKSCLKSSRSMLGPQQVHRRGQLTFLGLRQARHL